MIFYERSVHRAADFPSGRSLIMEKLSIFKKVLSFVTCSALSLAAIAFYPSIADNKAKNASARTIAEIQEERKANSAKIEELQSQIDSLEGDKSQEQQYQSVLQDQISIMQSNIDLINKELDSINADIEATQTNIAELDASIENQQKEIDANVELFKQRLCAMYIAGNDNLASVVVGTSSFYDMLSRVEMVNRIAAYDEELINSILADIDEMEQSKKTLESERLTLEMKLEEQNKRKQEKAAEMEVYYEKTRETQAEIDRITREQQVLEGDKADIQQYINALDAEEAEIQAEIARTAAEAQAAYEEQQRQLAMQQAQNSGYSDGYYEPPYVPAPSASGFAWPAPGFCYISSGYGYRWGTTHRGIDIGDAGIHGGAACASKAGTVISVNNSCPHDYAKNSSCGCGGGYGNYVVIAHDGTYSTLYGHLASAAVSVGQYVNQGDVIGYIGSTGWSTGAHLHFEVRVNQSAVDPLGYVSP